MRHVDARVAGCVDTARQGHPRSPHNPAAKCPSPTFPPSPAALTRCPHQVPSLAPLLDQVPLTGALTRCSHASQVAHALSVQLAPKKGQEGMPGRGDDDPPTTRPGDDPGTGRRRRNDVAAMRQRRCGGDDAATTTTTTGRRRRRHRAKFYCMRLPQSRTLYTETFCGKRDLWTGPVSQDVVMSPSGCSLCLPFV